MVALHAIGAIDASRDLHAAISAVAPSATSPLSAAFLNAAAEGCGSAGLHEIIISLIKNEPFESDIDVLARIGHTSGWDALAGAAVVLQAFSICGRRNAAPSSTNLP
jgi:3'-phosphoadenosine 5'-phosphosulfate (PAPS) 3'-phosphatase